MVGVIYLFYNIIIENKGKIFIPFKEYKLLILFLIWGCLLGLIFMSIDDNIELKDFIRDMFYYINPLVYLYIGAMYSKNEISIYKILNSLILASGILCFIELINVFNSVESIFSSFSVESWRKVSGVGVMTSSIALGIIFSNIIPKENKMSKMVNIICLIIIIIDFIVTLSRTNLLILVISYLVFAMNLKNVKKILKNMVILIVGVIAFVLIISKLLPNQIKEAYIDKLFKSFYEISSNHEWNSLAEIQGNWRGYETYCAIIQCRKSTLFQQFFGSGFGKRIYVGNYAYTLLKQTDDNGIPVTSIAVLHNGYATMLIKQGILGVILYLTFYCLIIWKGIKSVKKYDNVSSRILLVVGLIFLIQTYFLNGLYKDYCFYALLVLLGFASFDIDMKIEEENKIE